MKKLIFLFLLGIAFASTRAQVSAVKAGELMKRITRPDTLYVVNFWATWCAPCVAELPYFENVNRDYAGKPVKVLLVSLDFPEDYPRRLEVFLKNKKILSEVLWLDEKKPNQFIPKIYPKWSGSIPATLLHYGSKDKKRFMEKQLRYYELETAINEMLAP
jgi:thiol-disulfide isomerase/thioredoxin